MLEKLAMVGGAIEGFNVLSAAAVKMLHVPAPVVLVVAIVVGGILWKRR